jgi:hypothetical protein
MILPIVLCRCESLSLVKKEEHRLRVFENRVLRTLFEPKRERESNRMVKKTAQ